MIWFVALGSAIGGAARYFLSGVVQARAGGTFPVGTLVVNITGSLLLGFIVRYALAAPAISPEVRAFLTAGICGGYTTFSTFTFETAALLEDGQYPRAAAYIALSLGIALVGTFVGFALAREVLAFRERIGA